MRLTRKEEILSAAYAARIEIIEALREVALGGETGPKRLRAAAKDLDSTSGLYGDAPTALTYQALAELRALHRISGGMASNRLKRGARMPGRFLTAAQERATAWARPSTQSCERRHFGTSWLNTLPPSKISVRSQPSRRPLRLSPSRSASTAPKVRAVEARVFPTMAVKLHRNLSSYRSPSSNLQLMESLLPRRIICLPAKCTISI